MPAVTERAADDDPAGPVDVVARLRGGAAGADEAVGGGSSTEFARGRLVALCGAGASLPPAVLPGATQAAHPHSAPPKHVGVPAPAAGAAGP